MSKIRLEIVTPEGGIFDDDIASVTLPGSEGEFGVLPGHATLVSLLKEGVIDITKSDGTHLAVVINWGHAKVDETKITVLAEGAVPVQGDDDSEIAAAINEAKALIAGIQDPDIAIAMTTAKIESILHNR